MTDRKKTFLDVAESSVPGLQLPADACDAHCHVFGPGDVFPYAPERTYTPVDVSRDTLFALHRRLGLARGVIVQASCHGTDNAALVDALAAGDGRYRGIAMVGPEVSDAELARLHAAGVRGVRFNFVSHLGNDAQFDNVRAIVARIAPLGWHIVVHFDSDRLAALADFLRELPITIVIDHMGRPDASFGLDQAAFAELDALVADDDKFWVKVSGCERITREGPPYADAAPFARHLVELIPERVLWGTDFPHPNIRPPIPDDGALVDLIADFAPRAEQRQALLVDNPTRLYWND